MRPTAHLLWKEAAPLLPLALVLGLSVVAARMLDAGIGEAWLGSTHSLTIFFGVLAPFAFALGAAALLVTQEFELGTIYWLRSQPVGWRRVLSVKLAVSLVGLIAVWGVTLVCWAVGARGSLLADEAAWTAAWGPYLALNSLQVLFWAFLAALIGRGSLASLFLVVPAAFMATTLSWSLAALLSGASFDAGNPGGAGGGVLLALLGLLCLVLLAAVYQVAGRRLVGSGQLQERRAARDESRPATRDFYQPPAEPSRRAPSPLRALLWHHAMSWPGVRAMLFVSVLGAVALTYVGISFYAGGSRPSHPLNWELPLGVFSAIVLAGAIGASAMSPDNERGRQRFFADRGVSPAAVWWTRLVLPVLIILPLCVAAWVLGRHEEDPQPFGSMGLLGLLSAFAIGVLAGQLAARPVVGILAGTLVGLLAAGLTGFFLTLYPTAWWAYLPGVVILFALSLRLARRWLDGRRGWGLYVRAGGWMAAAVAIVLGLVVPGRLNNLPRVNASELASEAEAQRQLVVQSSPAPPVNVDPGDPVEWLETLRQGPFGEKFERNLSVFQGLLGHRGARHFGQDAVVPGATAEDFLRTYQKPLDEIAAAMTRANQPFEVSSVSLLALRLGAEGALQAEDHDRAVVYLTALLRAAKQQLQVGHFRWQLDTAIVNLQIIIDLMLEIEASIFAADVSSDARERTRAALREEPPYRTHLRSRLLLSWLMNREVIEEVQPPQVGRLYNYVDYRHAVARLFLLPWERMRSDRWLTAATERELAILSQSPEETSMDPKERAAMWITAAGIGGPGAERISGDRFDIYPSQAVDLAIAADQQVAQLLERLEQIEATEE